MTEQGGAKDAEFNAMQMVFQALEALDDDARSRVLKYIVSRLQVADVSSGRPKVDLSTNSGEEETATEEQQGEAPKYNSLAELDDAAQPTTNADKALVAGYWLQVCQGAENFGAFSANKELKNLGRGVANITVAIDALRNQKPSLALQLKKSGKSQQARKTYKLTVAGIKALENMIKVRSA
jgi:hypothetical protein